MGRRALEKMPWCRTGKTGTGKEAKGSEMLTRMVVGAVALAGLLIYAPYALGILQKRVFSRKEDGVAACFVHGYVAMFALAEIVFVPLIFLRVSFSFAAGVMLAVLIGLVGAAHLAGGRMFWTTIGDGLRSVRGLPAVGYAAVALILLQMGMYVVCMVTDLDDAYFVAAASTALHTDSMYQYSPYTGMPQAGIDARYVLSPMPMLTAFLSRCSGFSPPVVAHTALPPVLVAVAYAAVFLEARFLFPENKGSAAWFVLFLALANISSYVSVYTQGTFLLVRIWQGKAILAAILLPYLFLCLLRILAKGRIQGDLFLLTTLVLACCMVSSMGIALAPVLVGLFALLSGLLQKKWAQGAWILGTVWPCLLLGAVYLAIA